jgi:hypothetical protein
MPFGLSEIPFGLSEIPFGLSSSKAQPFELQCAYGAMSALRRAQRERVLTTDFFEEVAR